MALYSRSQPRVTQELVDELRKVFPIHEPTPNLSTMDDVMHSAGQQTVIEWLAGRVERSVILGKVE